MTYPRCHGEPDNWGNGEHTECHRINLVLMAASGPMFPSEIAQRSGTKVSLVKRHLQTLRSRGHIRHTDGGWVREGMV